MQPLASLLCIQEQEELESDGTRRLLVSYGTLAIYFSRTWVFGASREGEIEHPSQAAQPSLDCCRRQIAFRTARPSSHRAAVQIDLALGSWAQDTTRIKWPTP